MVYRTASILPSPCVIMLFIFVAIATCSSDFNDYVSTRQELVDCLNCLKPNKITPTVSVSKSQELVELLLNAQRGKSIRIC